MNGGLPWAWTEVSTSNAGPWKSPARWGSRVSLSVELIPAARGCP